MFMGFKPVPRRLNSALFDVSGQTMNNSSIFTADRGTHIRILVVTLIASIVAVIVGITARPAPSDARRDQIGPPVKVGAPIMAQGTANSSSFI